MGKEERFKGNTFAKNPQNINRKGRPRTTVRTLLDELSAKGYKTMTKEDIKLLYLSLLDNSQEELLTLTNDKDTSMIIRVVAKSILEKIPTSCMESSSVLWIVCRESHRVPVV